MEVNRMNTSMNIYRARLQLAVLTVAALILLPAIAAAHGGMEHVVGTVTSLSGDSVTVKTTAGKSVQVRFDAKTTFSRGKQTITKADLKVGDRVVIHASEVNEKLVAHTVELGTAAPASEHQHR
jgi:Na+/pantothenate symporter